MRKTASDRTGVRETTADRTGRRDSAKRLAAAAYGTGRSRGPAALTVDEGNLEAARTRHTVRSTAMSLRTVILMMAGIAAMTAALIYYIKVQSDVTATSGKIAELEQQLTEMRAENDAAYNEINDSISLEEVREKAIHELGMKYADRDQVVIYSGEEEDAVHQVSPVKGE